MKRLNLWIAFLLIHGLVPPQMVFGETTKEPETAEEGMRARALSDRTPGSFSTSSETDLSLLATEEGGRVIGRVTWANEKFDYIVSLEASAPLDEEEDETDLLDLEGLASGATAVGVSWTYSWFDLRKPGTLYKFCSRYPNLFRTSGENQNCYGSAVETILNGLADAQERDRLFEEFLDAGPVRTHLVTLSAGASNRDFAFLDSMAVDDAASFAELESSIVKTSEEDTSLGLRWSVQAGRHLFGVGYEYRNLFKAPDSGEFCAPTESGGAVLRCLETGIGGPRKIDQNLGLLEWRTYLRARLGLRVRLYWIDEDFRRKTELEDEWEAQVRLYFLQDKEKGLTGGIDVSYDTAFEDLTARAFIGQSFSLFD